MSRERGLGRTLYLANYRFLNIFTIFHSYSFTLSLFYSVNDFFYSTFLLFLFKSDSSILLSYPPSWFLLRKYILIGRVDTSFFILLCLSYETYVDYRKSALITFFYLILLILFPWMRFLFIKITILPPLIQKYINKITKFKNIFCKIDIPSLMLWNIPISLFEFKMNSKANLHQYIKIINISISKTIDG